MCGGSSGAPTISSSSRSRIRSWSAGCGRSCGGWSRAWRRAGCGSATSRSTRCSREVRLRGRRVELSQKEFALLRALAAAPTRVFTKEELLRDVWGYRSMGATRTLDSPRVPAAAEAGHGGRQVRRQRVGRRLPAGRRAGLGGGGMSALAYAGWLFALCAACGFSAARVRLTRQSELVADAGHELRGPLCAARLGLHGLGIDDAAAIDLELRRAALALDDLVAAGRGDRARGRSQLVDVGALLDDGAEAWAPLASAFGVLARRSSRSGAARSSEPTRSASPRRAATSWPTRSSTAASPVRVRGRVVAGRVRIEVSDAGPGLPEPVSRLIARRRARRAARPRPRHRRPHRPRPRRPPLLGAELPRSLPGHRAAERRRRPGDRALPTLALRPDLEARHPPDPARPELAPGQRSPPRSEWMPPRRPLRPPDPDPPPPRPSGR